MWLSSADSRLRGRTRGRPGPCSSWRLRPLDEGALVERLIERELKRAEVERFSVTLPDADAVMTRLDAIRARIATTGFAARTDCVGMSEARLRAWIEDDLRIERYVQQRFDVAAQPSEEEAVIWFQSREREFLRDGRPQPYAAVRDEVRARLAAEATAHPARRVGRRPSPTRHGRRAAEPLLNDRMLRHAGAALIGLLAVLSAAGAASSSRRHNRGPSAVWSWLSRLPSSPSTSHAGMLVTLAAVPWLFGNRPSTPEDPNQC